MIKRNSMLLASYVCHEETNGTLEETSILGINYLGKREDGVY